MIRIITHLTSFDDRFQLAVVFSRSFLAHFTSCFVVFLKNAMNDWILFDSIDSRNMMML